MKKSDYEHYCPSPLSGPQSYEETGKCSKQEQCEKIVKDFREMGVKHTSEIKIFGRS
jgi:hypothetical protein